MRALARSFALAFMVSLLLGCARESIAPRAPTETASTPRRGVDARYPAGDAAWGRYHSKRFQLSFPLFDGKGWRIDDHSRPSLRAVHDPTSSRIEVFVTREDELVNRQRCEARARAMGWAGQTLTTVDDENMLGPDAYDSRVWVALDATHGSALEGHVFLFGGFLRQCLLVHFSTRVGSAAEEAILSERLVLARTRIIRGIRIDPPRVHDDATVPRATP